MIIKDIKIRKLQNYNELIKIKDNKYIFDKYSNELQTSNKIKNYDKNIISNHISINRGLVFCSRYDKNWRHFILENFFNLSNYTNETIILSKKRPKYIDQILNILRIFNYIEIDDNTELLCKLLIIPEPTQQQKDLFLQKFINRCYYITKQNNLQLLDNIYLKRDNTNLNYRHIYNLNKFESFIPINYKCLIGGTIPLYYQISMINNAKNIITFIGANCENIIFCNSQCIVKIIYPYNCKKWARMYQQYNCNVKTIYCGNKTTHNNKDKLNWNYHIDFNILKIKKLFN